MAENDSTTPIGSTPTTLDPETQRAIAYALDAQAQALSRIRGALYHLAHMDDGADRSSVDEMVLEGAQDAEGVAGTVQEWLGVILFDHPDPSTQLEASSGTIWSAFKKLGYTEPASAVLRAIEGDDDQGVAA